MAFVTVAAGAPAAPTGPEGPDGHLANTTNVIRQHTERGRMKYIIFACLIIISCATGPLYKELPDGRGFEVLDPAYGKIVVKHNPFNSSTIDTLRVSPTYHAIFGDSTGITLIHPPKEWRNLFGPVTGIVFLNFSPDTMNVSLLSDKLELLAYKGLISMGRYQIQFTVEDFAPEGLNIVKLVVGEEKRYFKSSSSGFWRMSEIEYYKE